MADSLQVYFPFAVSVCLCRIHALCVMSYNVWLRCLRSGCATRIQCHLEWSAQTPATRIAELLYQIKQFGSKILLSTDRCRAQNFSSDNAVCKNIRTMQIDAHVTTKKPAQRTPLWEWASCEPASGRWHDWLSRKTKLKSHFIRQSVQSIWFCLCCHFIYSDFCFCFESVSSSSHSPPLPRGIRLSSSNCCGGRWKSHAWDESHEEGKSKPTMAYWKIYSVRNRMERRTAQICRWSC